MRVPFPYVERERTATRPALIFSQPLGPDGQLIWTLMITSARRGPWPGDIDVGPDHARLGLPVPCVVRTAKIATTAISTIDSLLGRLPPAVFAEVKAMVAASLDS